MKSTKKIQGLALTAAFALGLALCCAPASSASAQERPSNQQQPSSQQQPSESSRDAQLLYNDAANFQNNGALELAIEHWRKFIKRYPADPLAGKARLYLGVCNLQAGDFPAAIEAFKEVLAKHPKFEFAEDALLNLGLSQYSLAEKGKAELYDEAASTLGNLIKGHPESRHLAQALYFQGESLYRQGKKEESVQPFSQLLNEFPKSPHWPDGAYALGFTLEELGRLEEALNVYNSLLKQGLEHPIARQARLRKAETLLELGRFAEAEPIFGELSQLEDFPSAAHARFQQAFCAGRQERNIVAGGLFASIEEDFPDSTYLKDARLSAGRSFYIAEQYDAAAKWLSKVVEEDNKNVPEAAHWMCLIHIRKQEHAQAAEVAAKAIPLASESPYLVDLKMDEAEALANLPDRKADALDRFSAIAAEHPNHVLTPKALYNAAYLAWDLNRLDEALKRASEFQASFANDPLSLDVRFIAADVYEQQEKYAEAETILRSLVDGEANHADKGLWRLRLAQVQFEQRKYEEALRSAQPLIEGEKSAQADAAMLLMARSYRQLNELDDAKTTIERLLSEYPQSKLIDHATYRLGEYQYGKGMFDEAANTYARVIAQWPDSFYVPYAHLGRGWALLKTNVYQDAAASFAALLEMFPQHATAAEARFARGMCLRQLGQFEQAIAGFDQYLNSEGPLEYKTEALYERGLAAVALKNFPAAVESFQTILEDFPDDPGADRALYELAWAYKDQGKAEQASAHFARLAAEYPNSPMVGEALFQVAESHYAAGKFADAAKAYQQALETKPAAKVAEQASYKLGWAYYEQGQHDKAQEVFDAHLQSFPDGGFTGDVLFMKAESLFHAEKYEDALAAYEAVADKAGVSDAHRTLALVHGAQSASQLERWDEALGWTRRLVRQHPQSPLVNEAHYEAGWALQNMERYDEALAAYEKAAEANRSEVGARAQFMIGEVRFLRKRYEGAIRDFQKVMYGYGGAQAPSSIHPWQAKAGYEAGRCSDVLIGAAQNPQDRAKHVKDAIRFYGFVVERFPQDDLAKPSAKRLDELHKLADAGQ